MRIGTSALLAAAAALLALVVTPAAQSRTAVLRGLDKVTGVASNFEAPVGREATFGSLKVTVRACIQRPPEDLPETFVYLEVVDTAPKGRSEEGDGAPIFAGWLFASNPALNAIEHPVYDIWAIRCKA